MVSGLEKLVYYNLSLHADRFAAYELSLAFRNSGHTVLNYLSNIGATQKGNKYSVPRIPFAIL
jgi:hypothetical protein